LLCLRSVILSLINRVFKLSGVNYVLPEVMNYLWMDHNHRNENLDIPGPNQILEFIFIYFWIKTEKFTCPNKVLLVLGQRTGAHREDWGHIYVFFELSEFKVTRLGCIVTYWLWAAEMKVILYLVDFLFLE
jgi:hypothetical protein